mmetsp:Transcript_114413/g.369698  ORF Transcript_114413/g.369698 Transcript_114413/m.369698 type:complete len:886 (-) Transcript_114413:83-2740(-)
MGGASSYYAMLSICAFLSAAWFASKFSRLIGVSSIVLEISTGLILGPQMIGLVSEEYATCEHSRHAECKAPANVEELYKQGGLNEHLYKFANAEHCDFHSYVHDSHSGALGHGSGHGAGDGHADAGHATQHSDTAGHGDSGGHGNVSGHGNSTGHGNSSGGTTGHGVLANHSSEQLAHPDAGQGHGHDDGQADDHAHPVGHGDAEQGTGDLAAPSHVEGEDDDDGGSHSSSTSTGQPAAEESTTPHGASAGHGQPAAEHGAAPNATSAGHGQPAPNHSAAPNATSAGHGQPSANHSAAPNGTSAGHGETMEHSPEDGNSTSHGDAAAHSAAASGNGSAHESHDEGHAVHRRLSGGGNYDSFGECLEKTCEADVRHHCSLTPDVFTLIGHAGVALMIFESGMHFDFEKAREVGPWACVVAVIGTIMPLATGCLLVMAYGKPGMPQGISAGTALAPTSVGISLRLLGEAGVLQENFGQAIITAAFVDDILSLVLFNVLFSLGGEFSAVQTILFPIIGIIFMLLAMVAAVKFWPWAIESVVLAWAPDVRDVHATGLSRIRLTRDEILFLLMIVVLVVYSTITHLLGTHLWGCFIAGMSFACLEPAGHAHHLWSQQTKRITTWMVRIFFACTVAFSIPLSELLSWNAFWKGTIMGVGPCILTKVLCALFMGPARFVIGWAMVGRAEFAYLIAQMARAANMIDGETFSICIWALLYATIFAPFVFRYLLNNYVEQYGLAGKDGAGRALSKAAADQDEEAEEPAGGRSSASAHAEKGAQQRDFAGARSGDEEAPERLADLEAIKIGSGPVEKDGRLDAQPEVLGQPCEEYDSDSHMLPASSLTSVRPSSLKQAQGTGRKGARGIGATIFPGAAPGSSGLLCCLFFKKVVME